jgi:2-methylcitrate dehydratase PrpD
MNLNEYVTRFISETDWCNLPSEVQHQSKRCLMDTLGAMLAGMETPAGAIMARISAEQFSGNQATILVHGKRSSASGAALANGFAGNALDIDDGYRLVKGHPGACILPVILAAGEVVPSCSGTQFLTALIVGYEIGIRAGLIRHALYQTYHSSGSWGAVSGAAAAGKLLDLNTETLCHAMGTAEYHAPIAPMMKGIATPSMGKDSIGWGAMVVFNDTPNQEWIENLGRRYEIMNLYFKPYAACRWAHPAVAGALKISRENLILHQDISRICVRTFKAAGEVGPKQILPPRIHNSQILNLGDKLETEVSDDFEQMFPEKACAEVIIYTNDGKHFSSGPMEAQWEPPDTLPSDDELETKFQWLVEPVLGKEKTRQLVSMIWEFEKLKQVQDFIDCCVV